MDPIAFSRKVARGLPYLAKELRAAISDRTPLFIARPRVVHLWRRAPCNARCIMCDYGFTRGEALKALSLSPLTDEHIPRILAQAAELAGRGTVVSYMGGEPTTSPHLLEWVRQAGALGLDFRFTTNGYLVEEDIARRLVEARLFNIGVSLESLDPIINEAIRPHPGGTAKTIRAIDLLLRERARQKGRLSVNIKVTMCAPNMAGVPDIIRRWGRTDGAVVTPQVFEALEGMPAETYDRLAVKDTERLQAVVRQIKGLKREGHSVNATDGALDDFVRLAAENRDGRSTMHRKTVTVAEDAPPCNIATDNLWVQDGWVKLCPFHPPIGNVLTDAATLKEMWRGEAARRMRATTRACRLLCTVSCLRRTPLRHKVRTFLKIG